MNQYWSFTIQYKKIGLISTFYAWSLYYFEISDFRCSFHHHFLSLRSKLSQAGAFLTDSTLCINVIVIIITTEDLVFWINSDNVL